MTYSNYFIVNLIKKTKFKLILSLLNKFSYSLRLYVLFLMSLLNLSYNSSNNHFEN